MKPQDFPVVGLPRGGAELSGLLDLCGATVSPCVARSGPSKPSLARHDSCSPFSSPQCCSVMACRVVLESDAAVLPLAVRLGLMGLGFRLGRVRVLDLDVAIALCCH